MLALAAVLVLAGCQIELGSAGNTFGRDPTASHPQPEMWASINGPFTRHRDGDPYATMCAGDTTSAATCDPGGVPQNPSYDPNGYVWAVDVPGADVGVPMTVAVYDPSFGPNAAIGESSAVPSDPGFATSYHLFETTGDPSTLSLAPSNGMDALGRCTGGTPGYHVFPPGTTSQNAWYALCTFVPDKAGVYPLQVKSSGIPGVADAGNGVNDFSIRAVAANGVLPHVWEVDHLSLFVGPSGDQQLYLAFVSQSYAGHTMIVDLFDPGDGSGADPITMQFLAPPSGAPANVPSGGEPVDCLYNATPSVTQGGVVPIDDSPTCTIQTKAGGAGAPVYDDHWLRVQIAIPTTYACTTDCWWTVRYSGGTDALSDRTVWTVNLSQAHA